MRGVSRVLFYNDSAVLGGHEAMTAEIANVLAEEAGYTVAALYGLEAFGEVLSPRIERHRLPFTGATPLPFLRQLNPFRIALARTHIQAIAPDLVVVAQGTIEIGLAGVYGARRAGRRVVSYIPLAYTFREMGSVLAGLRDALGRRFYRVPDRFIVEDTNQAALVAARGGRATPSIIPYPVLLAAPRSPRREGGSRGPAQIGVIGRVYFRHKNQGILPDVVDRLRAQNVPVVVHVLGDGPDLGRLRHVVAQRGLETSFVFHGWLSRPALHTFVTGTLDLVVMPSHFEGVPLAMLEAVALGVPTVVGRLDCVSEYQMPEYLQMNQRDASDIARVVAGLIADPRRERFEAFRTRLVARHTREAFVAAVRSTFQALLSS